MLLKIFRAVIYGLLLINPTGGFTQQTQRRQEDEVLPAYPQNDLMKFVDTVQAHEGNYNTKSIIVENLGELSEDYYLDRSTFETLNALVDYVSNDRPGKDNIYATQQLQQTYLNHVYTYLNIYKKYNLPALKKSMIEKYESVAKTYSFTSTTSLNLLEEKFKQTWKVRKNKGASAESESSKTLTNSIKIDGHINERHFRGLIKNASRSPFQQEYKYLLDVVKVIVENFDSTKLPPSVVFLIEYSKLIIKKETDYLNDKDDTLKIERIITRDDFHNAFEQINISIEELVDALSVSESSAFEKIACHYIATQTANIFLDYLSFEKQTLTEIFDQLNDRFITNEKHPKLISLFETNTARVLINLNTHQHFTSNEFSKLGLKLIQDHIDDVAKDPVRQNIYEEQYKYILEILSPSFAQKLKDQEYLLSLREKIYENKDELDSTAMLNMIIEDIHNHYQFSYYPNEEMLLRVKYLFDLASSQNSKNQFLIDVIKKINQIHLTAYHLISQDENLHLPRLNKPVSKMIEALYKNQPKDLINELGNKFIESLKINGPILHLPAIELSENIDVVFLKELIQKTRGSLFEEKYILLLEQLNKIHDFVKRMKKSSPELILLTQYIELLIRRESYYLDDMKPTTFPVLTDKEFNHAVAASGPLTNPELIEMVIEGLPNSTRTQYINYIAHNITEDCLSSIPYKTPKELFDGLSLLYGSNQSQITGLHSAVAKAIAQLNITKPFTNLNFTKEAWEIIDKHFNEFAIDSVRFEIYIRGVQIAIEKFSKNETMPTSYLLHFASFLGIAFVMIMLVILLSGSKVPAVVDVIEERKKRKSKPSTTIIASKTQTPSQSQSSIPDAFDTKWEEFASLIKRIFINMETTLLDNYKNQILSEEKSSWPNKDHKEKIYDFIKINIDYLFKHYKDRLKLVAIKLQSRDLTTLMETKSSEVIKRKQMESLKLKRQQQIAELTKILTIDMPDELKFDRKNFNKAINYLKTFIPTTEIQDPLPENIDVLSVIVRQFEHQYNHTISAAAKNYILTALKTAHEQLKVTPTIDVRTIEHQEDIIDTDLADDDFLIPAMLTTDWQLSGGPSNAILTHQKTDASNKPHSAALQGIEFQRNYPYQAFAIQLKDHLNIAFDEQHYQLKNRAYKMLFIQFHSIIHADVKNNDIKILTDIRDRLCHKWDLIVQTKDLNVILYHVLLALTQTSDGSLKPINELESSLKLYPTQILALEKTADAAYKGKTVAKDKMIRLINEYDDTARLCSDGEYGEVAKLAVLDILGDMGETLRYSNLDKSDPLSVKLISFRNKAYHEHDSDDINTSMKDIRDNVIPHLKERYSPVSHSTLAYSN